MTTVGAVRELMVKRLEADSLDGDSRREMEVALEELDVMWDELQGQAALLVRENERYAEFFQYAPDAYLITDAGGNIREANEAALELLKTRREEVVGRPLAEYIAADDRVSFLARSVGLMPGGAAQPLAWQAQLQPREGTALAAQFSVRAIPLKKSGVGGLCWLVRPAT
ncbi:MAG TPA: PAS domain S-box protein [Burkholderiales bacterium]|nr:PAS domain S-box protein [Burkholderiales bacterium]